MKEGSKKKTLMHEGERWVIGLRSWIVM